MITLKSLPYVTAQEVFDQVTRMLLLQGKKSERLRNENDPGDGLVCMYRGNDGCKCAAGHLIGDDEYSEVMEYKTWDALVDNEMAPNNYRRLIKTLQVVHDNCHPDAWPEALYKKAKEFGLMYMHDDV